MGHISLLSIEQKLVSGCVRQGKFFYWIIIMRQVPGIKEPQYTEQ